MKKLILLSFILALMCSCQPSTENQTLNKNFVPLDTIVAPNADDLTIVVFDSCEYLQYRTYSGYEEITHRGRCKYCAERARQANLIKISL